MNNNQSVTSKIANNMALSQKKYIFEPNEFLLDNWTLWLAKEVVVQLRDSKAVELDLGRVINKLDLGQTKVFPELFAELQQKFNRIKTQKSLSQQTEKVRESLSEFFVESIEEQLPQISQDLKHQTTEYLQKSLSLDFQQASPKKLSEFLNYLAETLLEQKKDFDRQTSSYQEKEGAAKRAYSNLAESQDPKAIGNSLLLIFESQLHIARCKICSDIVFSLIQECQIYSERSRSSTRILNKIESDLSNEISIDLVSLPVFWELKKLDIDKQRKLLAEATSHSLNILGKTTMTWQEIKAKLLQNLEPEARQICCDFLACFMDNVTIVENLDKKNKCLL
jgi:uncharacterized protein YehS (DUF1456 family)